MKYLPERVDWNLTYVVAYSQENALVSVCWYYSCFPFLYYLNF